MIQVVIVEDTPSEAQQLQAHLHQYEQENHMTFAITHFENAQEFLDANTNPDLIFMDIDLPGMNGMKAAALLREHHKQTPLIFITNLAQFAVKGYEVDAIDFMVKPVSYDNFSIRMKRAMRVLGRSENQSITVISEDGMRVIALQNLVYIDIRKHDVHYHLIDGTVLKHRGTIKAVLAELDHPNFIKISASCIINMGQVRRIQSDGVIMNTGETLWFSRGAQKQALEALNNYVARA